MKGWKVKINEYKVVTVGKQSEMYKGTICADGSIWMSGYLHKTINTSKAVATFCPIMEKWMIRTKSTASS